ncbi:MAG TPA: hypothetical protein VNO50_04835 [Pyrinomonadaceae bacterium]|nr:hypothetical protein [Pyrinomonadaceae bacterium]
MNILKGIGAILAGIAFIVVTHSVTDLLLEKLGIFTPPEQGLHTTWMVVTATIYRTIYTIIGGYVTAALAPNPRMRYVIFLGIFGTAAGILGAIVTIPMGLGPAWYPIALAVLAFPSVWIGGKLKTK